MTIWYLLSSLLNLRLSLQFYTMADGRIFDRVIVSLMFSLLFKGGNPGLNRLMKERKKGT